jgi:ParB family chromosome partitioning protein
MSKKKRFGISEALTRGLTETINVVENNLGIYRNIVLPLSRIELDPDNPRKLAIDLMDVREGIRPDDPLYQQKQEELERLKELAHTIKANGVINPVVVYKLGEFYRVVAGERRCLASILAGKQEIEARTFNDKPKAFELKLIQWVENTAREDLSLDERLDNIREIITEYKNRHDDVEMTATLLRSITGLSLSQMTYYLAAINAPTDIQAEIKSGNIRNLDKAALLAGIASKEVRHQALQACLNGASIKDLRHIITQHKALKRNKADLKPSKQGRSTANINMGSTIKADVVKTIINCVVSQKEYHRYMDIFSQINWSDLRQTAKAFRKLIELLETEMAV